MGSELEMVEVRWRQIDTKRVTVINYCRLVGSCACVVDNLEPFYDRLQMLPPCSVVEDGDMMDGGARMVYDMFRGVRVILRSVTQGAWFYNLFCGARMLLRSVARGHLGSHAHGTVVGHVGYVVMSRVPMLRPKRKLTDVE